MRIVVLALVLPVRICWDALALCGRTLRRAGAGLGRLSYAYLVAPVGHAAAFLAELLFVRPWAAVHRHLLTPLAHAAVRLLRMLVVPAVCGFRPGRPPRRRAAAPAPRFAPRAKPCGGPGGTPGTFWSAGTVHARYGNRLCPLRVLWVLQRLSPTRHRNPRSPRLAAEQPSGGEPVRCPGNPAVGRRDPRAGPAPRRRTTGQATARRPAARSGGAAHQTALHQARPPPVHQPP